MAEEQFQRQTAKIASVEELLKGDYVVQDGWKPNYIQTNLRKLVRINIIGIIIEKPSPFELIIDDGTGSILISDFNRLKSTQDTKVGQGVLVIGRPRKSNEHTFIAAEIVQSKQIQENPLWLVKRKEDLIKISSSDFVDDDYESISVDDLTQKDIQSDESDSDDESKDDFVELTDDKIIAFIKKNDSSDGCLIESLIDHFGQEVDNVILTLIAMGEIYEIKPGRIKVLE